MNDPDLFRRLHLIILRSFATRKKCLMKNPLEKETRQKVSGKFCDHYVSTSVIEKIEKQISE